MGGFQTKVLHAKTHGRNLRDIPTDEPLLEVFLKMQLPDNWADMDLFQRRDFVKGNATNTFALRPRVVFSACEFICERFGKDLADLFESYDADINLGRYQKTDVTFYSDPGNNWSVPLDYVIDHKLIRRWVGIVSRQKKALKRDFKHITEFLIAMKEAELDRQLREDEKLAIINEHNRKQYQQS